MMPAEFRQAVFLIAAGRFVGNGVFDPLFRQRLVENGIPETSAVGNIQFA